MDIKLWSLIFELMLLEPALRKIDNIRLLECFLQKKKNLSPGILSLLLPLPPHPPLKFGPFLHSGWFITRCSSVLLRRTASGWTWVWALQLSVKNAGELLWGFSLSPLSRTVGTGSVQVCAHTEQIFASLLRWTPPPQGREDNCDGCLSDGRCCLPPSLHGCSPDLSLLFLFLVLAFSFSCLSISSPPNGRRESRKVVPRKCQLLAWLAYTKANFSLN